MFSIVYFTIMIFTSNGVRCSYIPNNNVNLPPQHFSRAVNYPLEETESSYDENDRSVYDPGVDNIPPTMNIPNSLIESSQNIELNSNENDVTDGGAASAEENQYGSHGNTNNNRLNNIQDTMILNQLKDDIKDEETIAMKSAFLLKLLEKNIGGPLPIVYVEDQPTQPIESDSLYPIDKRSGRYYRRYPWKRQNTRYQTYEADSRYLCVPSRDDVFKLLVGLHENRNGNHHKTVNFCNRKRPAKAIFTNIRFLG